MARFTTNIPKISKSLQQAINLTSSTSEIVKAARLSQLNFITEASRTTILLQKAIGIPDSIADMIKASSLTHANALTAALPPLHTLSLTDSAVEMIKAQADALTAALPSSHMLGLTGSAAELLKTHSEVLTVSLPSSHMLGLTGSAAELLKTHSEALAVSLPSSQTLGLTGSLAEMIKAAKFSQQDIINDALRSTTFFNDVDGLDSVFNRSIIALSKPEYFTSAAEIIERKLSDKDYMSSIPSAELNFDNDEDLQSAIDAEDISSFKRRFERLPIYLQLFLVYLFMQILQPMINNIAANLITPYVDEAIFNWPSSDRDKVKTLKNLTFEEFDTPMSDLRFISGDNVRLREMPSIKSEAIDELRIGRVVVFLSKDRNWTEIMVHYDEGESMSGWVFTRYVKRFNNVK